MASPRITLTLADLGLTVGHHDRLRRMRAVADIILAAWKTEARAGIRNPAMMSAYLKTLAIRAVTEDSASVELPGVQATAANPKSAVLARMAEFGMGPGGIGTEGPYDIRTFVLKAGTRKLRVGKSGPYVNVPFDMGPAGIKEAGATAGKGGASAALKAARSLSAYDRPAQKGAMRALPAGMAAHGQNRTSGTTHVADRLEGVVRLVSTYSKGPDGVARQQTTGYRKWRRMSWTGQPWMHPGIPAKHLGQKVAADLRNILAEVL